MLTGLRVVDLTRVLAGPLCSMTLGDLGADVLKIERPGSGDESRGWGPPFDARGESAYYLSVNRNKLGIDLDLDSETDRNFLLELIDEADVVIDNFRQGTLERRGVDPVALLAEHDRLIWCTLTGFGPASPRPGYDFVVQAESGWMSVTGEVAGEPMKVGIALADIIAGKDAAIAILSALVGRDSLGPAGRRLFISLLHSATAALVNVAQNALVSGTEARRWGNGHPNLVPYQLFRAADRHLVIAVGNDGQWRACCAALGLDAIAEDSRFSTNAGRLEHRNQVVATLQARLSSRAAADWLDILQSHGVPCGVVKGVREALESVQTSALTGIAPAAGGSIRLPPPMLGAHSALVREAGWGAFTRMRAANEPEL